MKVHFSDLMKPGKTNRVVHGCWREPKRPWHRWLVYEQACVPRTANRSLPTEAFKCLQIPQLGKTWVAELGDGFFFVDSFVDADLAEKVCQTWKARIRISKLAVVRKVVEPGLFLNK
jgi:hypothetical protein